MTKKDRTYFNAAKAISTMSDFPRVHIGCVVTDGHRIISSGFNTRRTHPIQKILNKERFNAETPHSLHSESMALIPLINKKNINWKKCNVYIYRELKNGEMGMCRPCPSCEKLIRDLGIKHIFYTTQNGYTEERWDYE